MSEWIDVPVADVRAGDECKVDGYGRGQGNTLVDVGGNLWYLAYSMTPETIWLQDVAGIAMVDFRRSSIVAVRRRKPEPSPKPGDWRCRKSDGSMSSCLWNGHREYCRNDAEVFRASGGWSRDERTGQPWVMVTGSPVEVVVRAEVGAVSDALSKASQQYLPKSFESWSDHYKRIGLDVRPVDRRGKR